MTEELKIVQLYKDMYFAMIIKDSTELDRIHDDCFELVHTTGKRQAKKYYISDIMNGVQNYLVAYHEDMQVQIMGDTANLIGKSRVSVDLFGGGVHTWLLCLKMNLVKKDECWCFTHAVASTY